MRKTAPRRHSQVVGPGGTYDWSSSPALSDDARQSPWSLGRKPPAMYRKAASYNPNAGPSQSWLGGVADALSGWYDRMSRHGAKLQDQAAAAAGERAKFMAPKADAQRPTQSAPTGVNRPTQFFVDPGAAASGPGKAYDAYWHNAARQRFQANRYAAMATGDEEAAKRWGDTSGFDSLSAYRRGPDPLVDVGAGGVGPGSSMHRPPARLPFDVSKPMDEYQRELYLADLSATHGANIGYADMARYNGGMEFDVQGVLRPFAEARGNWWDNRSDAHKGLTQEQLMDHGLQMGPMGSFYDANLGDVGMRSAAQSFMFPYIQQGYNPRQAYEMARNDMVQSGLYMPEEAGWNAWDSGWSPEDKAWFNQVAESGRAARFADPGGANGLGYYLRNPGGAAIMTAAGPVLMPAVGGLSELAASQFQDPAYRGLAGSVAGMGGFMGGMYGINKGVGLAGRALAARAPGLAAGASKAVSGLGRVAMPLAGINNIVEGAGELWDAGKAADLHAFMAGRRREGYNDRDYQAVSRCRQLARQMPEASPYMDLASLSVVQPGVSAVNQTGEWLMRPDDPDVAEMMTQRYSNDRLADRTLGMLNDPEMGAYAHQQLMSMLTPEISGLLSADPGTLDPAERDYRANILNALESLDYSSSLDRKHLVEQMRRNGVFRHTGD